MQLVGLDIGFSKRRRSNGIAVFRGGNLVHTARLSVAERDEALRSLSEVDVLAFDAPLLPSGSPEGLPRQCERVFSRGAFQKRCKPGMSHVRGTGRTLREHGSRAVAQLLSAKSMRASEQSLPHMLFGVNIVEAFPNTFLGVVLAEEDFLAAGQIKRGGKFDWLYDRWIEHRLFNAIIDAAHLPSTLIASCEMEHDHDIRAALVCLLTAGLVRAGNYKVVGDETSGYFFLPPLSLWAPWARREIAEVSA